MITVHRVINWVNNNRHRVITFKVIGIALVLFLTILFIVFLSMNGEQPEEINEKMPILPESQPNSTKNNTQSPPLDIPTSSTPFPTLVPLPTPELLETYAITFLLDRSESIIDCPENQQKVIHQLPQFIISLFTAYHGSDSSIKIGVSAFPDDQNDFEIFSLRSLDAYKNSNWDDEIRDEVNTFVFGLDYSASLSNTLETLQSTGQENNIIFMITDGSFGDDSNLNKDKELENLLALLNALDENQDDIRLVVLLLDCNVNEEDLKEWDFRENDHFQLIEVQVEKSLGVLARSLVSGTSNVDDFADGLFSELAPPADQSEWLIPEDNENIIQGETAPIPGEMLEMQMTVASIGAASFELSGLNHFPLSSVSHLPGVFQHVLPGRPWIGCPDSQWDLTGYPTTTDEAFFALYWWDYELANYDIAVIAEPNVLINSRPLTITANLSGAPPDLNPCYQAILTIKDDQDRQLYSSPSIPLSGSPSLMWHVTAFHYAMDRGPQNLTVDVQIVYEPTLTTTLQSHAIASASTMIQAQFHPEVQSDPINEQCNDNHCSIVVPLRYYEGAFHEGMNLYLDGYGYTEYSVDDMNDSPELERACTDAAAYPDSNSWVVDSLPPNTYIYRSLLPGYDNQTPEALTNPDRERPGIKITWPLEWTRSCGYFAFGLDWQNVDQLEQDWFIFCLKNDDGWSCANMRPIGGSRED